MELLHAKKRQGDRRLNFLVNRFEKDVVKLVKNVQTLSNIKRHADQDKSKKVVRFDETMISKNQFRDLWEVLKVCHKDTNAVQVMS